MSLALATQGLDPQLSSGDFPLRPKESLTTYSTHILPGQAIPSGQLLGGPMIARSSLADARLDAARFDAAMRLARSDCIAATPVGIRDSTQT
jgi:hypothetical protein